MSSESSMLYRREMPNRPVSRFINDVIAAVSPKWAYERARYQFSYDVIDGSRTRKRRSRTGDTGDSQLTEAAQDKLRETCRDLSRNNPLIAGILKTERDGVIGAKGVRFRPRTSDAGWNKEALAIWQAEMVDQACDVTGRYNVRRLQRMAYLQYRTDGDAALLLTDNGIQGIEGHQIGTPTGLKTPTTFDVVNGLAVSKTTKQVIGYYVGMPDKWGYIKPGDYKRYLAPQVCFLANPERFTQSRGEPALTPGIDYVDKLLGYIDAELIAAKVNACFSMFIARKDDMGPGGDDVAGNMIDENGNTLERLEPGKIMYGEPGEQATGIGQTRPGSMFDPFVNRILMLIGRPLGMPLMLLTLDYSGATYMNARIAYQKAHEKWECEQHDVVIPTARRLWQWRIAKSIAEGKLTDRPDAMAVDVYGTRWPYVDPYREAQADGLELENRTTSRQIICDRKGVEYTEVQQDLQEEEAGNAEAA